MLPVALALAETKLRGKDILAAYLVGVMSSRLNHAVDARHYADGFHTTGTLNVFGAACGGAHVPAGSGSDPRHRGRGQQSRRRAAEFRVHG